MENLEDIKVGDKVVVFERYNKYISVVQRITKTQIIVNGCRFRKSDGFMVGNSGSFFYPSIKVATPEMIAYIENENKRKNILTKLRTYPWNKLSTEQLQKVYEHFNSVINE